MQNNISYYINKMYIQYKLVENVYIFNTISHLHVVKCPTVH